MNAVTLDIGGLIIIVLFIIVLLIGRWEKRHEPESPREYNYFGRKEDDTDT